MGKLAFVFAGQGSQYPQMGRELWAISPGAKSVFALADKIKPGTSQTCFNADKEDLSETSVTQPTLFCVDLAAAVALEEKGFTPDLVAGFSLGEIPALAFAHALSHETAFRFVLRRGQLMAQCATATKSAMFAVLGLNASTVEKITADFDFCYPVNYNSPGQTVVACGTNTAEDFQAAVKNAGGKTIKLAVSGGFHSPFMDRAVQILAQEYADLTLNTPRMPIIANFDATPYFSTEQLFSQVNSPLKWQQTIEYMMAQGVDTFVEVGAGKTLSGLIKKISPQVTTLNVQDKDSLESTAAALIAKGYQPHIGGIN